MLHLPQHTQLRLVHRTGTTDIRTGLSAYWYAKAGHQNLAVIVVWMLARQMGQSAMGRAMMSVAQPWQVHCKRHTPLHPAFLARVACLFGARNEVYIQFLEVHKALSWLLRHAKEGAISILLQRQIVATHGQAQQEVPGLYRTHHVPAGEGDNFPQMLHAHNAELALVWLPVIRQVCDAASLRA